MADYDNPGRNPLLQTDVYISQQKNAKGCLRIRVLAGSECEKTLGVGEMPFLYAIGLLQRAERFLTQVDPEGGYSRACVSIPFTARTHKMAELTVGIPGCFGSQWALETTK